MGECEKKCKKMVVNVVVPEGAEVEYEEVAGLCQPVMYVTMVAVEEETAKDPAAQPEGPAAPESGGGPQAETDKGGGQ